ncbi:HEAT repeat domain-containing protein [Frateuria sp. MAH-13]|uniref:HEAT repeat domain-containing protein n=1 Tax=Frateuria flava TaxID=2821489 RepID=A0ABS4DQB4_9GAMM|nr:HEAT repeat domain-containing protein [Frateuria flava]
MSLPTVDELIALYSEAKGSDLGRAEHRLFQQYGLESLVPLLASAYPHIRRSHGRASILFWLPRYARARQDVVSLALSALADRSTIVREYACSILAYSLRHDVIPQLTSLLAHQDPKTRASAAAAIDAISNKNHHYYVDRSHSGSTFWGVNPGDVPGRSF